MQEQLGIPSCFSSGEKLTDDPTAITRSGQNVFVSVYRTKIADQCRLITVTWCRNLLLHGLSVSVEGSDQENHHICKVELKPWCFWRKHGSKRFIVDAYRPVDVFWDLRLARFNGEAEPAGSDYYVAVVSDGEVVLLLGNMKNEAYRKTGCRPALVDPILISRKEHVFGKRRFSTRVRFHERGGHHEISIECKNRFPTTDSPDGDDPEMEIRIDGHLAVHVKHLQWKFRGNELIRMNKGRIEVYYDVHDWLFNPGLRHALFIFKPALLSKSCSSSSFSMSSSPLSTQTGSSSSADGCSAPDTPDFCLFLYAWKVE